MSYGKRLAAHLEQNQISVRGLGAKLAPERPETGRRLIQRIIAGDKPREHTKARIAEALGVPADAFDGDPEDEEADLLQTLEQMLRLVLANSQEIHGLLERGTERRRRA